MQLPVGEPHGRAVGEHDDEPRVRRGELRDQRALVGGQVHVRAVEALGLVGAGEAEEGDDGGRAPEASWTASSPPAANATSTPSGTAARSSSSGDVDAGRVDLRAAGALVARGAGELADHRDRVAGGRLQRQERVVVLEQHRALGGDGAGERVVGVLVEVGAGCRSGARSRSWSTRATAWSSRRLVELAGAHRGDDRGVADAEVGRHLEVEPGGDRRDAVVDRAPVGHHEPVEAPLVAQHLGEQPVVLRRVGAVDLVVGAHHRPRPRLLDDALEAGQVDLAQRALVDVGRDAQPVGLLVVGRVVLDRRADALALQALDERRAEHAGDERVLGEVLEVAPAQRERLMLMPGPRTTSTPCARASSPTASPTRRTSSGSKDEPERARGREAGGGHAAGDADVVALVGLLAQAVRAVGERDRAGCRARGTGAVCQKSEPRHSEAFSSSVRSMRLILSRRAAGQR